MFSKQVDLIYDNIRELDGVLGTRVFNLYILNYWSILHYH